MTLVIYMSMEIVKMLLSDSKKVVTNWINNPHLVTKIVSKTANKQAF